MELEGDWWIRNAKKNAVVQKAVEMALARHFDRTVENEMVRHEGRNAGRSWAHLAVALGITSGELLRKRKAGTSIVPAELLATAMIYDVPTFLFVPETRAWIMDAAAELIEPREETGQLAERKRECRALAEYGAAWVAVRDEDWKNVFDPLRSPPPKRPFRDDRAARRALEALQEWPNNLKQQDESTFIDSFMERLQETVAKIVMTVQVRERLLGTPGASRAAKS